MEYNLKLGLSAEVSKKVEESDTARTFGSGGVDALASPIMFGMMETAALNATARELPEGFSTVGIRLDVRHLAATPVGMNVRAEAKLVEIDGKKLTFDVEAYDDVELVGKGIHVRYIVDFDKFVEKSLSKLDKLK